MKTSDLIIVGGGFAGVSAAIYTSRFNRSTLVLDAGNGRWNTHEINENYLGFPEGIATRTLHHLGITQAKKFGAEFHQETVTAIKQEGNVFTVVAGMQLYQSKAIIIASGVTDHFPHFHHWSDCLGKSLFWCITCDGYKTRNKRVVLVGTDDEAVSTALQFLNYTSKLYFVTNAEKNTISPLRKKHLQEAQIPLFEEKITNVTGKEGQVEKVVVTSGAEIGCDFIFSLHKHTPNSALAVSLGVAVTSDKYIQTDPEQRTNIPLVYAAGDVTKPFAHQIATAVHEGATAAQAANYDLYRPEQRE